MTTILALLATAGLILSASAQQPTTLATSILAAGASSTAFALQGPASTAFRLVTGTLAAASSPSSTLASTPTSIDLSALAIPSDADASTSTETAHTDLDSDIGSGDHDHGLNTSGTVHYYIIFISVFVCLIGLGMWLLYRRRRRRKARIEPDTRDALAHEISRAWRGNGRGQLPLRGRTNSSRRRWMQRGAPWHNRPMAETLPPTAERDEGLNELGEAPPAYVKETRCGSAPSISVASVRSLSPDEYSRPVQPTDMIRGPSPTIPLRALSRDGRGRSPAPSVHLGDKPPDYEAATSAANTPVLPSQATFAPR